MLRQGSCIPRRNHMHLMTIVNQPGTCAHGIQIDLAAEILHDIRIFPEYAGHDIGLVIIPFFFSSHHSHIAGQHGTKRPVAGVSRMLAHPHDGRLAYPACHSQFLDRIFCYLIWMS